MSVPPASITEEEKLFAIVDHARDELKLGDQERLALAQVGSQEVHGAKVIGA